MISPAGRAQAAAVRRLAVRAWANIPAWAPAVVTVLLLALLMLSATGRRIAGLAGVAVLIAPLMRRPLAMLALVTTVTVLAEGSKRGVLGFTSHLYDQFYKGLTLLDVMVLLAVVSAALDVVRRRSTIRLPQTLGIPLVLLVLGVIAGAVTGHANGADLQSVLLSQHVLAYLVVLPLSVANLELEQRHVEMALRGAVVLAIVKAVLGLIQIAGGYGDVVEGSTHLTYYEPTANWLTMLTVLGLLALVVMRERTPAWVVLAALPAVSLLLSYRRSFWIASVLGMLLVILLVLSPAGRRLLVPAGLLVAFAIWVLGTVGFQAQSPVAKRIHSLAPSKLTTTAEDRYRLDERANVLAELRSHPMTGLGMTIPWIADARPLGVEHPGGRLYVHFAALWFWLKLGIVGLAAYIALIVAGLVLAWRVWRASIPPALRAFGLASLCGLVGLVVMETTASFTGVDARFSVVFAVQIGLLAAISGTVASSASSCPRRWHAD